MAVPDAITQLSQLQSLNLDENRLTAVPDSIAQLSQLQSLNLLGTN
ncbi:MAG: leucine-rich repeat domain-containing protein [Chloroflexota bacterium]